MASNTNRLKKIFDRLKCRNFDRNFCQTGQPVAVSLFRMINNNIRSNEEEAPIVQFDPCDFL